MRKLSCLSDNTDYLIITTTFFLQHFHEIQKRASVVGMGNRYKKYLAIELGWEESAELVIVRVIT